MDEILQSKKIEYCFAKLWFNELNFPNSSIYLKKFIFNLIKLLDNFFKTNLLNHLFINRLFKYIELSIFF